MGVDKQVWPHSLYSFGPDFTSTWVLMCAVFTIPTVWWGVEDPTTLPTQRT